MRDRVPVTVVPCQRPDAVIVTVPAWMATAWAVLAGGIWTMTAAVDGLALHVKFVSAVTLLFSESNAKAVNVTIPSWSTLDDERVTVTRLSVG